MALAYAGSLLNVEAMLHRFVSLLVGAADDSHFAAMSGYEGATGIDRTGALADDLRSRGFNIVEGFGSYKGVKESSLLILPSDKGGRFSDVEHKALIELAGAYKQESFFVNFFSLRLFQYADGHAEFVGEGRYVVGDYAKELDYFSDFAGYAFSVV